MRRSRRRFWKSEDDGDKHNAYVTLHYSLCRISQLLAPWAPFVADKMWRELTAGTSEAKSVHLSDWPAAGEVDAALIEQMAVTRKVVTDGLAVRAEHKIKVRQPLASLTYSTQDGLAPELEQIIADEVNVKRVAWGNGVKEEGIELDTHITPELKAEGLMRDVVRQVQNARKASGLEVDDRIVLTLETSSKSLAEAIAEHAEAIGAETLAVEMKTEGASDQVPVKVDGDELYIGIEKAGAR